MPDSCRIADCSREIDRDQRPRSKYCSERCRELNAHRKQNERAHTEVVAEIGDADAREKAELRKALRATQTKLARAKAKNEDLVAAVYEAAHDAMIVLGPVPEPQKPKNLTRPKDMRYDEVALIHTTDWQLGKHTETYGMDICEQRVRKLAEKVGILTSLQRASHPVTKCHVMAGGDMVENCDIFPGQAYEVEETLFGQMFRAVRILVNFIEDMLNIFDEVEFTGEPGNHGRLGRRGQFPAGDNADRMVYEIARQHFVGNPRVTWNGDSGGWHQIARVGNYTAMLIHGDEIKSFGGNTPAFGLLRKGTAWASGVVEKFDDIYFGHFHTHMSLTLPNGGHMYGTGSTESDNAYAAEFVAAKGKPSQRLMFVDPRKGRVTAEYQVYLDDNE